MKLASALLIAVAALSLVGCGAEESAAPSPQSPQSPQPPAGMDGGAGFAEPLPPAEPPPGGVMEGGPPPAWVATPSGSYWLGYATYCWSGGCADYVAPRCGAEHVPTVEVAEGDTVTFHLDFEPSSASLTFFEGSADAVRLDPGASLEWTVDRAGAAWLSTLGGEGDAAYAACFEVAGPGVTSPGLTVDEALARGAGAVTVTGTIYAEGDEVRLCDGLAESYPPQCSSRFLLLKGFDLESEADLSREGEIAWGNQPTTVRGRLSGTTLVVDS